MVYQMQAKRWQTAPTVAVLNLYAQSLISVSHCGSSVSDLYRNETTALSINNSGNSAGKNKVFWEIKKNRVPILLHFSCLLCKHIPISKMIGWESISLVRKLPGLFGLCPRTLLILEAKTMAQGWKMNFYHILLLAKTGLF